MTAGIRPREESRLSAALRGVAALLFLFALALVASPATCRGGADPPGATEPESGPNTAGAPGDVRAKDVPNDDGGRIAVTWRLSEFDAASRSDFGGYRVFRRAAGSDSSIELGHAPRGVSEYIDSDRPRNGESYAYRIGAEIGDDLALSEFSAPAVPSAQWLHRGRISMLIWVLLLSVLILYYIEHARRGRPIFIRKIAGLEAVDEAVGRATEMGREILYIPGTQDMDQVQTLAGIAILGRVARLTAEYETPLSVPVSRSLVMVACRETVKEAYLSVGRPDSYSDEMVFYLTDDQFGYAAALEGIMVREKPATIFMQGSFYAESLILAETGNSIGAIQIAGTAQPAQLPFFVAACDYTLLGEELFVAGAYLSKEPRQLGSLKGQDMGKAIFLLALLIGIVIQTAGLFDFARIFFRSE